MRLEALSGVAFGDSRRGLEDAPLLQHIAAPETHEVVLFARARPECRGMFMQAPRFRREKARAAGPSQSQDEIDVFPVREEIFVEAADRQECAAVECRGSTGWANRMIDAMGKRQFGVSVPWVRCRCMQGVGTKPR